MKKLACLLALALLLAPMPPARADGPHDLVVATSAQDGTLRHLDPAALSVEALVETFRLTAGLLANAHRDSRITSYNHYYGYPATLFAELRRRGPEAPRALMPLLSDTDDLVRCEAARLLLGVEPQKAVETLKVLAAQKRKPYEWTIEPKYVLGEWAKGKLTFADGDWRENDFDREKRAKRNAAKAIVPRPLTPLSLEDARRLTVQNGLARYASAVEASLRPSIWLRRQVTDDDRVAVGASKLGGLPDLPAGTAWPMRQGRRMSFLAQVNLAEVARGDLMGLLPHEGLLSFYYDADAAPGVYSDDDRQAGAVTYVPKAADLLRTSRPNDLLPDLVYPASAIRPATVWMLKPGGLMTSSDGASATPAEERGYERLETALWPGSPPNFPSHRLLGWADAQQDEMEESLAFDGETRPEDWRLLLQLDSDEVGSDWMWGDAGMVYFWITEADLKARRFDRVVVLAQCG